MSKRVAILTSGGDAPGMNACIRAVIIACQKSGHELYGYLHGYNGLVNQEYISLSFDRTHNLIQQGGTLLHSARCKTFETDEGAKQSANNLTALSIDTLIVIGGDGSFKGLKHLSRFWAGQTIGIPGTIDNDIAGTDATIGYYTAIDTAMSSIDKVRDTADAFERVFLVEVMGRHAGFLALNAALSSAADYVLLPELFEGCEQETTNIITQIKAQRALKGPVSFIVVVAENVWPGGLNALTQVLNDKGVNDVRLVTLGHVQRGGSPVSEDRLLATNLGAYAASLIGTAETNVMVGEVNKLPVVVPLNECWEKKCLNSAQVNTMRSLMNARYQLPNHL